MTFKRAFTLIEVNLAMMIMAGGILSIVGLYAFGYRENSQSREDVAGAALADAVIGPLSAAIGAATDVTKFDRPFTYPSGGWAAYLDQGNDYAPQAEGTIKSLAKGAFGSLLSQLNVSGKAVSSYTTEEQRSGLIGALVISHEEGSGVVTIAFRATKSASLLMSQPLYFTEVRFQGAK